MKFKFLKMAVAGLVLSVSGFANATILDFEDLAGSGLFNSLPNNYAGISWAANFWAYDAPQGPYNAHSGDVRLAANGNNPGDTSFTFLNGGVTFDGAWFAGNSVDVHWELFSNNNLVHTSAVLNVSASTEFLTSGYIGQVDRVRIIGQSGQYVMDDLTFTSAMQVPEPSTLAILSLGLMGLAARRFKKQA
jgi:hypothetical protein